MTSLANQNGKSKVSVDQVWKAYWKLSEKDRQNPEDGTDYLSKQEELLSALYVMEHDDLLMQDGSDFIIIAN